MRRSTRTPFLFVSQVALFSFPSHFPQIFRGPEKLSSRGRVARSPCNKGISASHSNLTAKGQLRGRRSEWHFDVINSRSLRILKATVQY